MGDEQLLALCLLKQVSVEERLERSHLGLEVLHRPKDDIGHEERGNVQEGQ